MPSFAECFTRNLGALTVEQQHLLRQKRVVVVGCGGLGGYVVEQLVRIGVGQLYLFDPDNFSFSNCNRQLNAIQSTLGRNKAQATAERVESIHPFSTVHAFAADFRTLADGEAFTADAVVDCLDSGPVRRDLAALCNRRGLPLVHGAVAGWYGQVGVQLPGGDLVERLYPTRSTPEPVPSVLAFTVAIIASLQVVETIKLLLCLPSALHNSWIHIDLKEADFFIGSC